MFCIVEECRLTLVWLKELPIDSVVGRKTISSRICELLSYSKLGPVFTDLSNNVKKKQKPTKPEYLISHSICIQFLSYSLYSFLESFGGSVRGAGSLPAFHSRSLKLEPLILDPKLSRPRNKKEREERREEEERKDCFASVQSPFLVIITCSESCPLHVMNNSNILHPETLPLPPADVIFVSRMQYFIWIYFILFKKALMITANCILKLCFLEHCPFLVI